MASQADLIVSYEDYEDAYQKLDTICDTFDTHAREFGDLRSAVGEQGKGRDLANELSNFAESWRVKRKWLSESFAALSQEIEVQVDAWKEADAELGKRSDVKIEKPKLRDDDDYIDGNERHDQKKSDSQSSNTGGGRSSEGGGGSSALPPPAPNVSPPRPDPTLSAPENIGTGGSMPPAPVNPPLPKDAVVPEEPTPPVLFPPNLDDVVSPIMMGGTVGAIYAIWKRVQDQKAAGEEVERGGDLQERIRREMRDMGLNPDNVDISTDPKDPDDIIAILKGKDGEEVRVEFDDGDGDPTEAVLDKDSSIRIDDPKVDHGSEQVAPDLDAPLINPQRTDVSDGVLPDAKPEVDAPAAADPNLPAGESLPKAEAMTDSGSGTGGGAGGSGAGGGTLGSLDDGAVPGDAASYSATGSADVGASASDWGTYSAENVSVSENDASDVQSASMGMGAMGAMAMGRMGMGGMSSRGGSDDKQKEKLRKAVQLDSDGGELK